MSILSIVECCIKCLLRFIVRVRDSCLMDKNMAYYYREILLSGGSKFIDICARLFFMVKWRFFRNSGENTNSN